MQTALHEIREKMATCAKRCGRSLDTIQLLPITKGHSWKEISFLYQEGCRGFGENRLQELLPKYEEAPKDIHWHFVGTLQKNKVPQIIALTTLIHSVDSRELAKTISECSKKTGRCTSILLQANCSGEKSKHGLTPTEWLSIIEEVASFPNLLIKGLMTMAPLTQDERIIRTTFASLRHLRDQLQKRIGNSHSLEELSMGMSNDYLIAIEEGATLLRIGSALFVGV